MGLAARVPDGEYRYMLFLNEERTRMLTAWPGIKDFQAGAVWTVEKAIRHAADWTWGPPDTSTFEGDYDALCQYAEENGYTHAEGVA